MNGASWRRPSPRPPHASSASCGPTEGRVTGGGSTRPCACNRRHAYGTSSGRTAGVRGGNSSTPDAEVLVGGLAQRFVQAGWTAVDTIDPGRGSWS